MGSQGTVISLSVMAHNTKTCTLRCIGAILSRSLSLYQGLALICPFPFICKGNSSPSTACDDSAELTMQKDFWMKADYAGTIKSAIDILCLAGAGAGSLPSSLNLKSIICNSESNSLCQCRCQPGGPVYGINKWGFPFGARKQGEERGRSQWKLVGFGKAQRCVFVECVFEGFGTTCRSGLSRANACVNTQLAYLLRVGGNPVAGSAPWSV